MARYKIEFRYGGRIELVVNAKDEDDALDIGSEWIDNAEFTAPDDGSAVVVDIKSYPAEPLECWKED